MFDEKIINTMTDKVNELIEKYNEVCEANEALRNELVSVKAQNEAKVIKLCVWKKNLNLAI